MDGEQDEEEPARQTGGSAAGTGQSGISSVTWREEYRMFTCTTCSLGKG